jgi:hypothetical protein
MKELTPDPSHFNSSKTTFISDSISKLLGLNDFILLSDNEIPSIENVFEVALLL